jgi:multidrug efflux pump subunit AcrB
MKIAAYAVKNYQFTLVIFLMVIALGVNSLLNMPRAEDPEMKVPYFPVYVVYPGASPEDIEELVVNPLERRITGLEDIDKVISYSLDGLAIIRVDFKHGADTEVKYQDLVRELNSARSELPADIYDLRVQKILPSNVSILQIALIAENATRKSVREAAERLQDALESIPELKLVEIHGIPQSQVKVELQLEKMARMGITASSVMNLLKSEMASIPGGSIEAGTKTFNIKTSGNFKSAEDVANTLIYSSGGQTFRLKDVADVFYDEAEEKHITRLNGYQCVLVTAAQKDGNNIAQTQDKYTPVLEDFRASLPPNISMVKHFDQADNVNNRLNRLGFEFLIAILLVAITLLPLGFRAAFIVMVSIPLSLSIGLVMLDLLGYTLNQLSIVGLVVALGLLVDDSIVVVENIERWLREGYTRKEAAIKATDQIVLAVLGCTATLVIAFLPLVFLPEASGDFIRSLPMAVILTVVASMLVSLSIIPFLSSVLLKQHSGKSEGNVFLQTLQKLIHRTYAPLLKRALHFPLVTLLIALIIFGASLLIVPVIGFSLFPPSEKPQFFVNIQAPIQTHIHRTNEIAREIEQVVASFPEVVFFTTNVGNNNPHIYYNENPDIEQPGIAQIFVQLKEGTSSNEKLEIISRMRAVFEAYPHAKVRVKNFVQGPPVVAPVEVRLFGENLDSLEHLAEKVELMLEATPGAIYVSNPLSHAKTDVKININREKAAALGIPTVDIDRSIRLAIAGFNLGKFTDSENNEYDVQVSATQGSRPSLDVFDRLYVNNIRGTAIPINQVADWSLVASPISIKHYNKSRSVSVTAFVDKGYLHEDIIKEVINKMESFSFPSGYTYSMGGDVETKERSFGGFGTVIIITAFLFIGVLILEFKTFKSTLIVLSVIPLGIVGAVIALWVTGNSLSFVAVTGLIALAGIEVKNSILLVDFTNQLRRQGMSVDAAIKEAGELRFLPIILTTATAIGGLTPIALSTNPLIAPLAIVLIGGLISSTLLSRVVTPVVYKLIPPKIDIDEVL